MAQTGTSSTRQAVCGVSRDVVMPVSGRYLCYLPPAYADSEEDWPLLLFLHGMGERGDDPERVKVHGPPKLIEAGQDFPFVVVSPLCPGDTWWRTDLVLGVLDDVVERYRIDRSRVYLTGLSMGGYGTWVVGCERASRFAALVPVCGGGIWFLAPRLVGTPVWAFHGAKDETVPLAESERMVEALKDAGGDVRLTIYPEAGHDSWTEAYGNPDLYEWLLEQRQNA